MAVTTNIGKVDAGGTVSFVGQGDVIVFDNPTGGISGTTTLADFPNAKSLGQIVQDSSSWEGEDASTEEIRDEQGNTITVKPIAGTNGYSIDIASTSKEMLVLFLNAVALTAADIGASTAAWLASDATAVGFGVDIPSIERPILWVNDLKTRSLFFPKAKITSNFAFTGSLFRVHATVVAQNVNTTHLKTAMLIEGALAYTSGS